MASGVPDLDMNMLPVKDTLTQPSRGSFCMARGILNISDSSFKKICFFPCNEGGGGAFKTYFVLTFDVFNGL